MSSTTTYSLHAPTPASGPPPPTFELASYSAGAGNALSVSYQRPQQKPSYRSLDAIPAHARPAPGDLGRSGILTALPPPLSSHPSLKRPLTEQQQQQQQQQQSQHSHPQHPPHHRYAGEQAADFRDDGEAKPSVSQEIQNLGSGAPPARDADGKFPCPYCAKSFARTWHLTRHLRSQTGDRPYMCTLCSDTFARSDVLKRHFQKCSIPRTNPTGAQQHKRPRRPYKDIQRTCQCGWDGCDKAYGNRSHLKTHIKSHVTKRTPEECKEENQRQANDSARDARAASSIPTAAPGSYQQLPGISHLLNMATAVRSTHVTYPHPERYKSLHNHGAEPKYEQEASPPYLPSLYRSLY